MRFGLAIPHYDTSLAGQRASWDGIRATAELAERCGFDSLWVSDHLFLDWSKYGGPPDPQGSFECWTTMSGLAAVTERVRIGSLTACNDLRNPGLLAKMAASLDVLSGGRLDIGLGAGWYEPEYAAAGIPFDRAPERIDRLGEAVEILGRLLAGEELTYESGNYSLSGAVCRPRPRQQPRPPIWVGGKGDRLLSVVARVADGWNYAWLGELPAYLERADAVQRACERAGRDPGTVRRSVAAYVFAGTDTRDAQRRFGRLVERTPSGVLRSDDGRSEVSWEQFRSDRIAGSVAEVTDKLGELAGSGVEEVIVGLGALPFQVADHEDVELFGTEVASALR